MLKFLAAGGIVIADFLLAYLPAFSWEFKAFRGPAPYAVSILCRIALALEVWRAVEPEVFTRNGIKDALAKPTRMQRLLLAVWAVAIGLLIAVIGSRQSLKNTVLAVAELALLYPVLEEIVYRRLFLAALLKRHSIVPALIINAGVFILLHVGPYGGSSVPLDVAVWVLIAVLAGTYYHRTRSVLGCMLIHSTINALLLVGQLSGLRLRL